LRHLGHPLGEQGDVKPLFLPTPTPTRFATSYTLEGDALFTAGQVGCVSAIIVPPTAYREAASWTRTMPRFWRSLSRIQTYSTALLVSQADILARLDEAIASAEKAVEVNPDNSNAHAVYSFALNWKASYIRITARRKRCLTKSEQEAVRASNWTTPIRCARFLCRGAGRPAKMDASPAIIEQALQRDPSLMDVHRVHAYVLESLGEYALAIQAYDRAIAITPNLTFLYLRAGAGYRRLAFDSPMRGAASAV
jgi:tetratricopeptide (TPR) repeat protein